MEVPQRFCVRWNSYKTNLQTAFPKLLTSEHFVDVTLACEKQYLKCHKIVLSACSVYFEDLLVNNPCQHPIIFMKDVAFWEMKALVEFMYKGEVNVSQDQLDCLLKSAESLQIRGLSGGKQWVPEPEGEPKKRKRDDDDDKAVQITSCQQREDCLEDTEDESSSPIKNERQSPVRSDRAADDDDTSYMENTDEDTRPDEIFPDPSREPGPSNVAEFISLDDLEIDDVKKLETGPRSSLEARLSVRNARRSCYKQYTMQSMWAALERIEQGLSVYRASLEYGVPRKTLRNWMKKYNILSYFDLRKQHRLRNDDA